MTAAKFITFEGGEGSGKSTQARLLAERLRASGLHVDETREPGGSPFAERLRKVILDPSTEQHSALSEALLFYSARCDHLEHRIRPALKAGTWVICDRFSDSTRAYQGYAGDLSRDVLAALETMVVADTKPDLTLILDVEAELGMKRADQRRSQTAPSNPDPERDRFEARSIAFHTKLRDGFRDIAAEEPDRCVLINADRPREDIAADIWQTVERRLLKAGD